MVITIDKISSFKKHYDKVIQLVTEDCKNDPPTDLNCSFHKANDILFKMQDTLNKEIENNVKPTERDRLIYTALQGAIYYDRTCISSFVKEKLKGNEYLMQCLKLLKKDKMEPETLIWNVNYINELALALINIIKSHGIALQMLEELERFYEKCKKYNSDPLLTNLIDDICLFDDSPLENQCQLNRKEFFNQLEKAYTLSCLYRAEIYEQLNELTKSEQLYSSILTKILSSKSYNQLVAASNAQTLSLTFISNKRFRVARRFLTIATLLLNEFKNKLNQNNANLAKEQQENEEILTKNYADLAKHWCIYGLSLLHASKTRLLSDESENITDSVKTLKINEINDTIFNELAISTYEKRVSCDYCLVFDDAKKVYHFVINWLKVAKKYYKPNTDTTEYSHIICQYAKLYKNMAFFESEPNLQSKMYKRCAKYYEELIDLLNPKEHLYILRKCRYGAGFAYHFIFENKTNSTTSAKTPNLLDLQKFEKARQGGIKHFTAYIESYWCKDGQPTYDTDHALDLRHLFSAYYTLGSLYYKVFSSESRIRLENWIKSLKYYKLFIDECLRFEEIAKFLKTEVDFSHKMVNNLTLKISNIERIF